jgi:ABC-type sugar transport system ATPase subunit
MAVIIIFSETQEIIGAKHRLLTMCRGELTGEFEGAEITEANLIDAIALKGCGISGTARLSD